MLIYMNNMLEKGNYMRNYNFDTNYVEDDCFDCTLLGPFEL